MPITSNYLVILIKHEPKQLTNELFSFNECRAQTINLNCKVLNILKIYKLVATCIQSL